MTVARDLVAEAWRGLLARPVVLALTAAVVGAMCCALILTTGRTVGAERDVLDTIDAAGTRMIVVRADAESGLDTTVLERLDLVEGIEWTGAFGKPVDVRNAALPDGLRVPLRTLWSEDMLTDGWQGSAAAYDAMAMPDRTGVASTEDGLEFTLSGELETPEFLGFLEPLVIRSEPRPTTAERVDVLVVLARDAAHVSALSQAVLSVLGAEPDTVAVQTSESLASIRLVVEGRLGGYGRDLVIGLMVLMSALIAVILSGLVMLRRKDFGRARALGARQGVLASILILQIVIASAAGATLGSSIALALLAVEGQPRPDLGFIVALGVLACASGAIGGTIPAALASRRDPLRELRTP